VLLLLAPFDFLLSLPGMLTRQAYLSVPDMVEQDTDSKIVLTIQQRRSYPARSVKFILHIDRNGLKYKRFLICKAKGGSKCDMLIDTSHSGITIYKLKQIWIVSLIGLFALPVAINRRASVLILPKPVKPPRVAALPRGVIFRPKPGGGFAEDYDLRPYRPGDPIRSVHWKLSAKLNSLTIREPLVPPPHSRLIHAADWNTDRERDLTLGRLRWISNYLLKWDLPYFVKLGDDAPVVEISDNDALMTYIHRVLEGLPQTLPASVSKPSQFAWIFRLDGKEGEPD